MQKTKERQKMEDHLLQKGDLVTFPKFKYVKITRMIQDMNVKARAKGLVKPTQILYSAHKEGKVFYVIRNI